MNFWTFHRPLWGASFGDSVSWCFFPHQNNAFGWMGILMSFLDTGQDGKIVSNSLAATTNLGWGQSPQDRSPDCWVPTCDPVYPPTGHCSLKIARQRKVKTLSEQQVPQSSQYRPRFPFQLPSLKFPSVSLEAVGISGGPHGQLSLLGPAGLSSTSLPHSQWLFHKNCVYLPQALLNSV